MPKLLVLTPKQLLKKLNKLGFIKDHQTGSHIVLYNSETKRRTVVPYHLQTIPKGTLNSLLKEAGIEREEILKK